MKNKLAAVVSILLSGLIFYACNNGGENKFAGYDTTPNGLKYKIHTSNPDGPLPVIGDLITMKMSYGTEDTVFFNTNLIPDGTTTLPLVESVYPGDIYEGMGMMHPGDSATFVVVSDSFFLRTANFQEIPPYAQGLENILINIKVEKFQTEQQARLELETRMTSLQLAEDSILQNFIEINNLKIKPTESGLIFDEIRKGYGKKPVKGDVLTVHFGIQLLDGTKIFSTKDQDEPVQFEMGAPFDTKGMDEGVSMMTEGGEARLIMPSNLAFGERGRGNIIPPYTSLVCNVELLKIENQGQFLNAQKDKEQKLIDQYVSENSITAQPTQTGLYYIENEKGAGPKAEAGDKVKVWYTGKLLDGTVFDASSNRNQAFEFTLGQHQVINGWDEGIAMMNQGGKATLLIPSILGYGERGSGKIIPPFSPLIFEVELQEVIKQ
nr:FKBP-type peptidyl-prolyl cis-trans isomerase [Bacteroidota bacterium]